jgi:hypothetical protein
MTPDLEPDQTPSFRDPSLGNPTPGEKRDLLTEAKEEISAMAKQGMAHPSTKPVLTGAAFGAVAGIVVPFVTLPIGALAGAGYMLYRRLQR